MPPWFEKKPASGDPSRARPAPVRIGELLREDCVMVAPPGLGKEPLLRLLVGLVCRAHGLPDADACADRVLERERGISTTLDTGLSLPHARLDPLRELAAGLCVVPGGIPDPQHAGLSILAIFLFFSPNRQEFFAQHLQVLRGVASLFKPELVQAVSKSAGPKDVLALVRAREAA
jgi:PTS system nitrogen regulatory IIA component